MLFPYPQTHIFSEKKQDGEGIKRRVACLWYNNSHNLTANHKTYSQKNPGLK